MNLKLELAKMSDEGVNLAFVQVSTIYLDNPDCETYDFWTYIYDLINDELMKRQQPKDDGSYFTNNVEVRREIKNRGLKMCAVAERCDVSNATFSRWLQRELDPIKKREILQVISNM